jgi:polyketide biosynthesis acyl carrier protein
MKMDQSSQWRDIFDVVVAHAREVVPSMESHAFIPEDSLRELGANSMDRAEIVMSVMETLSLSIPRIELFGPRNIGELVDLIHAKRYA